MTQGTVLYTILWPQDPICVYLFIQIRLRIVSSMLCLHPVKLMVMLHAALHSNSLKNAYETKNPTLNFTDYIPITAVFYYAKPAGTTGKLWYRSS